MSGYCFLTSVVSPLTSCKTNLATLPNFDCLYHESYESLSFVLFVRFVVNLYFAALCALAFFAFQDSARYLRLPRSIDPFANQFTQVETKRLSPLGFAHDLD